MSDVVVTLAGDDRRGVFHAATHDGKGVYVWCYGTPDNIWWFNAPEGAFVNCLLCLAHGPRGEWERHAGMGDPLVRTSMRGGKRVLEVDTETK